MPFVCVAGATGWIVIAVRLVRRKQLRFGFAEVAAALTLSMLVAAVVQIAGMREAMSGRALCDGLGLALVLTCVVAFVTGIGAYKAAAMKKLIALVAGSVIAGIAGGVFSLTNGSTAHVVEATLAEARLANLPKSAKDVHVHMWENEFSSFGLMRFSAPQKDIEAFVAGSPGLASVAPEIFSPAHRYLSWTGALAVNSSDEYFIDRSSMKVWFDPTVKDKGRKYELRKDVTGGYTGYVVIDDEKNTVYIEVNWS